MTYTVYYKKTNSFFWKKLKKVKGDGIIEHGKGRWFILDDETRLEIPVEDIVFKFSKDRHYMIKQSMEKESGQRM